MPGRIYTVVNPVGQIYPSVAPPEVAPEVEQVVEAGVVGRRFRAIGRGLEVVAIRCGGLHPSALLALGVWATPRILHRPCRGRLRFFRPSA